MIKTPVCIITANNKPLNTLISSRIISVTVTDNRANEADELSIVLDDSDGALELPKRGVKLNCKMGYLGEDIHDKGDFVVDETEWSGTASEVAKNHELTLVMTADLKAINLAHVDQTNESDLNLLQRLAKQNGAEMAVKKDRLLIFKAGSAKTASGKNLPAITLTRKDGDQFRYSEQDRESDHTGVSASYQDTAKAKREKAVAGEKGKVKHLKGTFANKEEAERASAAKMAEIKRQMAKFSINLAYGLPEISTESPIKLQGFKADVDKLKWIVEKATHSYAKSGGLVTQLELEASL